MKPGDVGLCEQARTHVNFRNMGSKSKDHFTDYIPGANENRFELNKTKFEAISHHKKQPVHDIRSSLGHQPLLACNAPMSGSLVPEKLHKKR
jgi:hypothetical protein